MENTQFNMENVKIGGNSVGSYNTQGTNSFYYSEAMSTSSGGSHNKMANLHTFRSMISSKASSVIFVRGLNSDDLTYELIFSLFCNFGNVQKIIFIKKKYGTALV
jgi:RNA recognition motif. (a.k.a. RRM, RBD, or RNP domain)